jgi:hypothetical protein
MDTNLCNDRHRSAPDRSDRHAVERSGLFHVRTISENRVTFAFRENRDCDVSGCHEGDAREGIKEGEYSLM